VHCRCFPHWFDQQYVINWVRFYNRSLNAVGSPVLSKDLLNKSLVLGCSRKTRCSGVMWKYRGCIFVLKWSAWLFAIEMDFVMHAGILIHMIPPSYIYSSLRSHSLLYDAVITALGLPKRDKCSSTV
jgi:hypothetical protein